MELPNGQVVRQRRIGGVREMVQEVDAFIKVTDDVKEEPKAVNGILTVLSFTLIFILFVGEVHNYFTNDEVEYRFSVDTDENNPMLEIDMIVASPCNNLAVMPMGVDSVETTKEGTHIKKTPTRYEMNEEEDKLWEALKRVHRDHFTPGTPLKGLDQIKYVGSHIEEGLELAEEEKERLERLELEQQRAKLKEKKGDDGDFQEEHIIMMIGTGLGVFQIIAAGGGGGSDELEEGTACRISGKVPVLKGSGDRLTITIGKSLPIGNMIQHLGPNQHGNISHRIEKFHFGPHIWGLVSPLAGNEQYASKPSTVYKYFIKVVPTRIYSKGLLFGQDYLSTYQYAVTYSKHEAEGDEHLHDSIIFDYEFVATAIEVHPVSMSLLQLSLRICSIVGGMSITVSAAGQQQQNFSYLPKIVNGGIAGIVGVTCVFPIDLVKTRLQNQKELPNGKVQYQGILDCGRQTWRNGGPNVYSKVRSLYSGSGVNILLITPEKAIKLVANDFFRYKLASPNERKLSIQKGMLAGGAAGFCQIIVTTPMELLKIQMQQATSSSKISATKLAVNLIKEKGIFGLYRGLAPTMARDVTFSVMYFPLFAALDALGPRKAHGSGDAVFYASFLAGIVSGAIASFSVTPLDVIKTRIQLIEKSSNDPPQYRGILDAFRKILKNEGPRAFFKGAGCRMMVMAPLFGIAQMVYFIGVAEFLLGREKSQHV